MVEGRTPKSERDRLQRVVDEIRELQEEYGDQAPVNVLTSNLIDQYGMSEEKVEEIIKQLKHKGVVFEPSNGYLKIV